MDETPTSPVDELVRDGVAEQRARGVIPRINDVRKYIAGVVEDLERRNEDNRLRIKPKAPPPAPKVARSTEDMETEYAKRCRRAGHEPVPGSWTVTRQEAKPEPRERSIFELRDKRTEFQKRRLRARLRLLAGKPDWAARIKRVNPLALQGQLGPDKQRHAEFLIREVISDSDRVFGPWMKAPAKRLHFT